ncbi:MAG: hypothetical protein IJL69_03040, partial [Oscillospiraceae bacterium]|nr:hypothetical protein [Oscillospiraceae bacterium]
CELVRAAEENGYAASLPSDGPGRDFGAGTMTGLMARWESEGYPDGIAYAAEWDGGDQADGERSFWRIGFTGDAAAAEAAVRAELTEPCVLTFVPAGVSRNEADRVFFEVREAWGRRFPVAAVEERALARTDVPAGAPVTVWVSPLVKGLYERAAARRWGGAVAVRSSWQAGAREDVVIRDSLGNRTGPAAPDRSFDLWLGLSAALVVLALIGWGAAEGIAAIGRRRRGA